MTLRAGRDGFMAIDRFDCPVLADRIENGVEEWNQRGHTLRAKNASCPNTGIAGPARKGRQRTRRSSHFPLIDFDFGTFDAFGNPAAALRLGKGA